MCFFRKRMKRRNDMKRLTWLNNEFICKDLYAPFKIYHITIDNDGL